VKEGIPAEKIVTTGNTIVDALYHVLGLLISNSPLSRRVQKQFDFLDTDRKIILVTGHRRDSFDGDIGWVCRALASIAERSDVAIIFPVHPNPNVREPVYRVLNGKTGVYLIDPVSYPSFVYLLTLTW
jgi:UDP-N-acetylglucosamine 2-epimerase (non-hydrolysing)